jgi:hypothetical protein
MGMGLDRLVGLLPIPIRAPRIAGLEEVRTTPARGAFRQRGERFQRSR